MEMPRRPVRPLSPPPQPPGPRFDVMFQKRGPLGLGLEWQKGQVVVVNVDGAAKRAEVQLGDAIFAIDGVQVRSLDEAYERLRTGTRPTRITFQASEGYEESRRNTRLSLDDAISRGTSPQSKKQNKVHVITVKCEVFRVGTPTAYPKDAVLSLRFAGDPELGRVQLRGALSKPAKRAVVAVRASSGSAQNKGINPGDLLVAVDDALVAPPPNAKGVALLVNKCVDYAKQRRDQGYTEPTTLVFARYNNPKDAVHDLLYTIALPIQRRRSSFGANQVDLTLLEDLEEEEKKDLEKGSKSRKQKSIMARFRSRHTEIDVAARCWGLQLDETSDALVVAEGSSDVCGAATGDVVALLDNRPACAHSLVTFGVAADDAVESAESAGRRAVALTLAHPDLFAQQKRLFLGDDPMPPPPSASQQNPGPGGKKKKMAPSAPPSPPPPDYDAKVEDDLELTIDDEPRRNSIVLRESWGVLAEEDRRRVGELMRMLRSGLGVEVYKSNVLNRRESRGPPRGKPMTLVLLSDCSGLLLRPVYGARTQRIHFADIVGVDMPMTAIEGVPDEKLAASFYIKYRVEFVPARGTSSPVGPSSTEDGQTTATLDLATESPVIAHKLADSILVAMRHCANTRRQRFPSPSQIQPTTPRRFFGLLPSAPVEISHQGDDDFLDVAMPQRRPMSASRFSRGRVDDAIQRATRRIARVALVTNASNPKQQWWKTLRRGVVVEVLYADSRTYTVKTPLGVKAATPHQRRLDQHAFREGQYCRAEVVRAVRSRGDRGNGNNNGSEPPKIRYILKYRDGPYDCDVAEPTKVAKHFMKGTLFVDVPRDLIVVNMRDQELYLPYSVIALSLTQIIAFIYFAHRKPGGVSASGPTIGPTSLHYFLTSEFPQCNDARRQYWRLFTYQFAHIGYYHLAANIFVQIVFGLPVELVHGHLLLFFVYQLGVGAGSLTCSFSDIHKGVVGASGGVYTLIGLHSSDCLVNWRALAQDMRLLVRGTLCAIVPALDITLYLFFYKDDGTSYASHIGGWIAGFLFGLAFLQQVSESFLHIYFTRPLALTALVTYLVFAFLWHQFTYPPKFFLNGPFWELRSYTTKDEESNGSCCWQLLNCDPIDQADYSRFSCDEGTTIFGGFFRGDETLEPLDTCSKLVDWLDTHPASEAAAFD